MPDFAFAADLGRIATVPRPFHLDRLSHVRSEVKGPLKAVWADPVAGALLDGVAGNSPFLARLILRSQDATAALFDVPPNDAFQELLARVEKEAQAAETMSALMVILRRTKEQAALLIAMADIGGLWTLEDVTAALTHFAGVCLRESVRWLLADAAVKSLYVPRNPVFPDEGSGFAVLAMGKCGAFELNYSSDIDIVVFFDPDVMPVTSKSEPQKLAVTLTRNLVKIFQDTTEQGYVFRLDLRLRPDAGATQVAVSIPAAERYYEALGQNWERAAFIKARAVAGDQETAAAFLSFLEPFVWRKYLDFAAIEDIHAIKRQIRAQTGSYDIAVEGHNVKLGQGGIREIEFFVQTQQLIAGGRTPPLRVSTTLGGLRVLARHRLITTDVARELSDAYRFLRTLEHRLQMVEDMQTHTMPRDADGVDHIACFMGFENSAAFRETFIGHLSTVQARYNGLFEVSAPEAEPPGSLVFTGVEDDPGTVETLTQMGFRRPSDVCAVIRGWHHGRIRATRSRRSREVLTQLMPVLLKAFADTVDPDLAFSRFDHFLSGLPAGVQFFSLLRSHPELLGLLADTFSASPRLADYLARHSGAIDALLDEDFLTALPDAETLELSFKETLLQARHFEHTLDEARRFARDASFRIDMQVLRGRVTAADAGPAYSLLAETVIRELQPLVEAMLIERHGYVPGGALGVVALGKLGARELTATSDLDLIFIFDHDGEFASSDGRAPLHAPHYFARLSQRMINALAAPTSEGKLYEVDMRLRPSGNKGPIATRLESFVRYHHTEAWTWEAMALTRARIISGPQDLQSSVTHAIRTILCQPRDPDKIREDVRQMRSRVAQEFKARSVWDLKYVRGGLLDLEFIAQALQLIHANREPSVLQQATLDALTAITQNGFLGARNADEMIEAVQLYENLTQLFRIAVEGNFHPDAASSSLNARVAAFGGAASIAELEERLTRLQSAVSRHFETIIGDPDALS